MSDYRTAFLEYEKVSAPEEWASVSLGEACQLRKETEVWED